MNKPVLSGKIRQDFPHLTNQNHFITSPRSDNYNCIAWAFGIDNRWIEPANPNSYWPFETFSTNPLEAMILAYQEKGYEKCDSQDLEAGYLKVAIYVGPGGPLHAAVQLESGNWTSKLGNLEDIQHDTLSCLEGEEYGKAQIFFKKLSTCPVTH